MSKIDLKKIKPIHKFLLVGILPLLIIAGVVYQKSQPSTTEQLSEKATSPFMTTPTERDTFDNKSNIERFKENKYNNNTNNSFGGALDIDVSEPQIDSLEIDNENKERLEEKKSTYRSSSNKSTNYYSQNNTNSYNNSSTTTQNTIAEEEVEDNNQRRRRTSGGTTTTSSKAATSGKTTPMIHAVIHNGNKAVKSGSTVRIRITEDCLINGVEVKRNTIISAIAAFSNERIKLNITSLSYNGQYVDTKLTAYDLDGIHGIFVPGGIKEQTKEDVSSSSADAASGTLPIIGGLAKDMLKKSIKEPSAIIYDNHKITLRP